ncbi:retinol dehydrogenase 11-like [Sitophilus oryzae]|uniref:Retinol dehydrogenase 11-like n=1 Tax=Sitophilus oryzae TaxID=7048 RepID=A0A6J2YK24_SITOR|nr:retinol dehydrogenase 11-like [Sitophilus oryzae]
MIEVVGPIIVAVLVIVICCVAKIGVTLTTKRYKSDVKLTGKTVLVTGASSGIGHEVAIDLATRGARLIVPCMSHQEGKTTCRRIIEATGNSNISYKIMDLRSLKSIRAFCEELSETEEKLDILINNAGVMHSRDELTKDGLQVTVQVNYFGPFLLTNLLLDLLKKSNSARIVNITTGFMISVCDSNINLNTLNEFNGFLNTYCRSKLYFRLFNVELARKLTGSNITTYSVYPGSTRTNLLTNTSIAFQAWARLWMWCQNSPKIVAESIVYCAIKEGIERHSGRHFENCGVTNELTSVKKHLKLCSALWSKSEQLVKLNECDNNNTTNSKFSDKIMTN